MESGYGHKYYGPNRMQLQSAIKGHDHRQPRHSPLWVGVLALMILLMAITGLIVLIVGVK
jgi:hypothetical protein